MLKLLAIAVCIAICRAQESEVDATVNVDVCPEFCRASSRCPSATAIIITVLRFPRNCRECITEECGALSQTNRTEVAECMFMARLVCEDECQVSNASRTFHENCVSCLEECEEDVADGNTPVIPTRPSRLVRPSRPSRNVTKFRGRFFNSRTGRVNPFSFTGRTRPGSRPSFVQRPARCSCMSQCRSSGRSSTRQCQQCVSSQCRSFAFRRNHTAYSQCASKARMSCSGCASSSQMSEGRSNCIACIRNCTGMFRPGATGKPMGGRRNICSRNCVVPGYCPSTDEVISTIRRTTQPCQTCVMEACASMANSSRDMMAKCFFEARPNCESCELNSASMNQRQRCSSCRMQCENTDTSNMGTTEESAAAETTTYMPTEMASENMPNGSGVEAI